MIDLILARYTLLTVQIKKGISIVYSSDLDPCVETENLILKKKRKKRTRTRHLLVAIVG